MFDRFADQIEAELREIIESRPMPLYRMMSYHLGWIDEQGNPLTGGGREGIRSTLCLMACEAAGGDPAKAMPAAAAIELAHNFYLIHDDVQDGNPQRDNRASVWWHWGPAQAINAGDGMHALARLSLFRLKEKGLSDDLIFRGIQFLDEACLKLCEGHYLDISYQESITITVNSYFTMIEGKAGALVEGAMKLGALVASQDDALIEAMGLCGKKLGMASQVREDILDTWSPTSPDSPPVGKILNKKKTLPVLYAIETGKLSDKRELGEIYFKRVLEPQDVGKMVAVLDRVGAREYCQGVLTQLYQEALESLDSSGLSPEATQGIREAAQYMVQM